MGVAFVRWLCSGSDTMEDEVESATAPTVMLRSATLMQGYNENYLKIYPLRKGMRERQKVMRASRDPRVYILTPLYQMKGTPPAGEDVSKAGKGGKKEEGTGGDNDDKTGANNEDKTGGGNEEKREETSKKVKQKTKKKEKKSNFQEEDACERIIIPTLDPSAQVRKENIMKLCTLRNNRFYCKGMLYKRKFPKLWSFNKHPRLPPSLLLFFSFDMKNFHPHFFFWK